MVKLVNDLKSWTEVTRGLYRYVIAAGVCYEIHLEYHDLATDILTAKASLYIVGTWNSSNSEAVEGYFERECLLAHSTVQECLEATAEDDDKNNSDTI